MARKIRKVWAMILCLEEVKDMSKNENHDIANTLCSHFHVEAAGLLKRPMSRKTGDFNATHRPGNTSHTHARHFLSKES